MRLPRLFALCLLSACGGGAKAPPAGPTAPPPAPPVAAQPAPPAELVRKTGATKLEDVPATGQVSGRAGDARAVYLFVTVEGGAAPLQTESIKVDAGGAYGLAMPTESGDRILVRLPGKKLPDALTLVWTVPKETWDGLEGGQRRTVRLTGLAAAPTDAKLPNAYFRAASAWFAEHGRARDWSMLPFYAYASARMTYLADKLEPKGSQIPTRTRRTELGGLMDLYTGMTSVDEALQNDRGLLLPADVGAATLPASSVAPLALPAHPWDKMIGELPGKPAPVVETLAGSVPADFLYLHAHDLRRLVILARALDERFAPIAALLEQRGASADMVARLERQLAVERTGLAEKLGHLAAGGVALIASDPFFREGTDVSLLFLVKNEALLGGALADFAKRSGGAWSDVTIAGQKVRLLSTPDGSVHRYELRLGDVLILSNSAGAVTRLVEVAAGKRPSLAAAGDFRYFRALYPARAADEDVFVFASDGFIQAAVSPRVKILEARRLRARGDFMAVNYAALLHGWLEGHPAASGLDLTSSGLGAIPYTGITFSPGSGATSARMGNALRLTPIIDQDLGKITTAEKEAYERFRETYQQYWRGYIDPIGARFSVSPEGEVRFDARMLPLISGTDYDKIREQVGERTVVPPVAKGGAHFVLAVGDDAMLRREIDRAARSFGRSNDFGIGWLGDWVAIGAADRSVLWDLALFTRAVPELAPRAREQIPDRRAFERRLFPRLPFYAMAHVRSRLGLVATLAAIRKYVDDAAPGMLEWGPTAAYRGVEAVKVGAKPHSEIDDELADLAIHYGIAGDVLVIAVERSTFEHAVDLVLDGRAAKAAKPGSPAMQTAISIDAPLGGAMRRVGLGLLEELARRDTRSAARQWEAVTRGKVPMDSAVFFLGETPLAAVGGTFGLDADDAVAHSLYGSEAHPVLPDSLPKGSPLAAALDRLAGFDFGLAFEGKGAHQGLHSAGRLR